MQKDNTIYLEDILNHCEKIISFTDGISKEDFLENELIQDAVVRNIEVIGEAANKLTSDFKIDHPGYPVRDAITMRNKLIHDYTMINYSIVWDTIVRDIPKLRERTQEILK